MLFFWMLVLAVLILTRIYLVPAVRFMFKEDMPEPEIKQTIKEGAKKWLTVLKSIRGKTKSGISDMWQKTEISYFKVKDTAEEAMQKKQ